MGRVMQGEMTTIWGLAGLVLGAFLFVRGGLRFRRWAVEDRVGIPRFPTHAETILLWLIYSGGIALVIVLFRQALRHL